MPLAILKGLIAGPTLYLLPSKLTDIRGPRGSAQYKIARILAEIMTILALSLRAANSLNADDPPPLTGSDSNSEKLIQVVSKPLSSFEGQTAGETRDLVKGIKFVWCPKGQFEMGTPHPRDIDDETPTEVSFSSGFWLGQTEVTQGQWTALMKTSPWSDNACSKAGSDYPACFISHDDATDFVEKLTLQERSAGRLPVGWRFALPTEAQWEYACRATTTTPYGFGLKERGMIEYGWCIDNTFLENEAYAHPVGLKKANNWGLKDMHGNVLEWCADWYDERLSGGTDPIGPTSGDQRSTRGGCFVVSGWGCRSARRSKSNPAARMCEVGFRLSAVSSGE